MERTLKSKILFLIIAAFILGGLAQCVRAEHEAIPILQDKTPYGTGLCLLKGGKFFAFTTGLVVAPKGQFILKNCILFGKKPSINPTWILLFDKDAPSEIIEWADPNKFKSVWKSRTSI